VRASRIHSRGLIHATTSHGVFEALFGHSPFCFDYSVATSTPRNERNSISPSRRCDARLACRHLWGCVNKSHFVHLFRYLSVPHDLFRVFAQEVSPIVGLLPCRFITFMRRSTSKYLFLYYYAYRTSPPKVSFEPAASYHARGPRHVSLSLTS